MAQRDSRLRISSHAYHLLFVSLVCSQHSSLTARVRRLDAIPDMTFGSAVSKFPLASRAILDMASQVSPSPKLTKQRSSSTCRSLICSSGAVVRQGNNGVVKDSLVKGTQVSFISAGAPLRRIEAIDHAVSQGSRAR
jgi:hypothetical protein